MIAALVAAARNAVEEPPESRKTEEADAWIHINTHRVRTSPSRRTVVRSPSWPLSLSPQHQAVPSLMRAQPWPRPSEIWVAPSGGGDGRRAASTSGASSFPWTGGAHGGGRVLSREQAAMAPKASRATTGRRATGRVYLRADGRTTANKFAGDMAERIIGSLESERCSARSFTRAVIVQTREPRVLTSLTRPYTSEEHFFPPGGVCERLLFSSLLWRGSAWPPAQRAPGRLTTRTATGARARAAARPSAPGQGRRAPARPPRRAPPAARAPARAGAP